ISYSIVNIIRLRNRQLNLRDDKVIRNLGWIRSVRLWLRTFSKKKSYENNPAPLSEKLSQELATEHIFGPAFSAAQAIARQTWGESHALAISGRRPTYHGLDDLMLNASLAFLSNGCTVQYTTAYRHPIELVRRLHATVNQGPDGHATWDKYSKRIV